MPSCKVKTNISCKKKLQAEFTFTELLEGKFDKFYTPDPANKKV
jgi:hypothetical protein